MDMLNHFAYVPLCFPLHVLSTVVDRVQMHFEIQVFPNPTSLKVVRESSPYKPLQDTFANSLSNLIPNVLHRCPYRCGKSPLYCSSHLPRRFQS